MIQPQSLLKRRYQVGARLGEGGMAIVFLGHDLELGRDVAIKTLRPQFAADPTFRERFARESRAAAHLAHPNIIEVYDVGDDGGTPYMVMELVRGPSLKAIIASEAPFHSDDVAALIGQIGAALDHAHQLGYVHRDIKPGNILIDALGRARLVDFGIAKGIADGDLTEAGGGFGSAGYVAPEQAVGLMATPASDIYSVGIVVFEMLTGRLPFSAESTVGLAMKHVNEPAPAPSRFVAQVPSSIDAAVLRALDKDPTRRWNSVASFADALCSAGPLPHESSDGADAPASSSTKGSSQKLTLAVVVLVLCALVGLLWFGLENPSRQMAAETPDVIVPVEPVITGGLDDDRPTNVVAGEVDDSSTQPTATIETELAEGPAPTIAPASQATIVVPNLQGLTIAGSTSALLPLGLRIAQAQPTYSNSVPLNAVVSQDPLAGTPVSPGSVVRVSLSRGSSPFGNDGEP